MPVTALRLASHCRHSSTTGKLRSCAGRKGRCALFADCGLGKSFMQIAWAHALDVPTLLLAPLCVAEQTVDEAAKLGIELTYAEGPHAIRGKLTITNYERLDRFDPAVFGAVVLDESSILKAFDGKTRTRLIEAFGATRYRLCCTATPSPNDIAELANHAEFLGLMTRAEFLATWFVHDDEGWRMKKHARPAFYRWLASWAMTLRTPGDLGYSDDGYILPPLRIQDHVVMASRQACWREPPHPDRWKRRSRTYPGFAAAMAEQWSKL